MARERALRQIPTNEALRHGHRAIWSGAARNGGTRVANFRVSNSKEKENEMETAAQASEVLGDMVISHTEGANLGSVKDVYIDTANNCISGISFRPNVMTDTSWIAAKNIELFGEDVILVSTKDASMELVGDATQGKSLRELKGHPVVTDEGRRLGTLEDLELNGANRTISELFIDQHRHIAVTPEEIKVGPDEIVVPASYENRVADDPNHVGLMERMKERRTKFVQSVKGAMSRDEDNAS